jgi:hypothetical protein
MAVSRIRPVIGHGPSTAPSAYPKYFSLMDTHGKANKKYGWPRLDRYYHHTAMAGEN